MKNIIHTIGIALMLISFSGCDSNLSRKDFPDAYIYNITVGFRDVFNNDLVAPLSTERWKQEGDTSFWHGEINPEQYKLDILLPFPHESWDNSIYNFRVGIQPDIKRPYLELKKYDDNYNGTSIEGNGYWYLHSSFPNPGANGFQKYLTYKFSCPTIYGDDSEHEVVAYWDEDPIISYDTKDARTWQLYPECRSAKIDGKEVIVKKVLVKSTEYRLYYSYFIDIVLDK